MRDMTAGNLRSAFGGESMAHMRYKAWSDKAAAEGFPNVARLFQAVSASEQAHATGHFSVLSKDGGAWTVTSMAGFGQAGTAENLKGAIEGEMFEINEMYPAFIQIAQQQGEKQAERSFNFALAAEKIHAALYAKAKAAVEAGKDVELGALYVCPFCGHTVQGEVPDRCPVCGGPKAKFMAFV